MTSPTFVYQYDKASIDDGGFQVKAAVAGGSPHPFQLDTGSSGMAIGVNYVGSDYKNYPCFGPGQFKYNPSENLLQGDWYLLPVSLISAASGNPTADSVCMVLVVTSVTDGDGNVTNDYKGGMMGVSAKGENIAYNVLLNASLPGQNGAAATQLASAYALTKTACTIGQTHVAGDGYDVVNLQPVTPPALPALVGVPTTNLSTPIGPAWSMPSVVATFSSGGVAQAVTAAFEMDTGIDSMLVVVPSGTIPASFVGTPATSGQATFVDGVLVTVTVPGTLAVTALKQWILNYSFTTGSGAADPAPSCVILMPPPTNTVGDMVRVNVGIHPLIKHNYLYDAQNGVIGMQLIS